MDTNLQKAMFGAGCFWGVEAEFRRVKGVKATAVGYSGGRTTNPNYKDVCAHHTGHAEVVEVDFDPKEVSYEELLRVFWDCHDPTTMNRQGPDIGSQYRSAIFHHGPEQEAAARKSKEALQVTEPYRGRKIVTEITAAQPFYSAEDYHQQYLERRGMANCHIK